MRHRKRKNSGFTLVELSISIAILALGISALLPIVGQVSLAKKRVETTQKMERILNALGSYVASYNDLPCPGDPNGVPFGAPRLDCLSNAINFGQGVVPFRALGLQESDIVDGWGNYLTYRLSPAFKADVADPTAGTDNLTHARCRTTGTAAGFSSLVPASPAWVPLDSSGLGRNVNIHKARFCCQSAHNRSSDIVVRLDLDGDGTTIFNSVLRIRDHSPGSPASFTSPHVGHTGLPGDFTAIAVVLVSHGPNGHGAMIKGRALTGPNPVFTLADVDPSSAEEENANRDQRFEIVPQSYSGGASYFDDIVMYRTNDTLYQEVTGRSCAVP